jgi:hypothetical protein
MPPELPVSKGLAAVTRAVNESGCDGGRLLMRWHATVIGHDRKAVDAIRVCLCR